MLAPVDRAAKGLGEGLLVGVVLLLVLVGVREVQVLADNDAVDVRAEGIGVGSGARRIKDVDGNGDDAGLDHGPVGLGRDEGGVVMPTICEVVMISRHNAGVWSSMQVSVGG
jgi:hypothetical protein